MSNLTKTTELPSFWSLVDDLWKKETFFGRPDRNMSMPAVNVKEQKDQFIVEFSIPGFKKEDISVTVEGDVLHVKAETTKQNESEEGSYTRSEFSRESVSRSISLPDEISTSEVSAKYQDGVLEISLKKLVKAEKQEKQVIVN